MAKSLIVEILGSSAGLQEALSKASASAETFGGRMEAAGARVSRVGATLTKGVTLPIVAIGALSAKAAIDFQNSMELLHTQAGVGQTAVESLSKQVLALAGPTATAPDVLSQGLYHLASQGLRGSQAMDALKASAEGAKLGQANLEDVTNALGAVIVSQIGGVHSYGQAMGELNTIVGAGDMRMQDLADAMGTGLPANAKIAGVSLDQVGGALATFGDNNIRGARAGTLLNSTLRIMSAPSMAAAKALATVGIGSDELGNKLRNQGLIGAVEDLKGKMDAAGLSATQQGVVLTRAFGGRQATGVKILIDELDRLKTKTKEVGEGGGKFASDWTAYTKTTAYHLASMGAQMQATGVTIGDVLLPVVAKVADVIGNLAAKFDNLSPRTQHFIEIAAGIAAALGPVLGILGSLITVIGAIAGLSAAAAVVIGVAGAFVILAGAIAAAVLWPDKMKDALERMGLSAQQAGQVVADLREVFDIVRTAVIDLLPVFRTTWETIKGVVKGAMEEIQGVIDVIDGLIHGNWSKVWKGLGEIVKGALLGWEALLRGAVSILGGLAELIGKGIEKGILEPLAKLAGEALNALKRALEAAIHDVAGWVAGAAESIGESLVSGILRPLGGLKDKVDGAAHSGLSWFEHPHFSGTPFQVASQNVGIPLGRGVIAGFLEGTADLPAKVSSSVKSALEQARKVVSEEQSSLTSAFTSITNIANKALAAMFPSDVSQTPAGKQLAALQAQYATLQNQQALASAQQQLKEAQGQLSTDQAGGADAATIQADQDAVTAAEQSIYDAQYQIQVAALQKQADQEAAANKKKQANQKQALDSSLAVLEAHLRKEGATHKQAQDAIVKLLKGYGVTYKSVAAEIGKKFADGLRSSIHLTAKAAEELAKEIAKYLPHSPAEKGPLSEPIGWETYLLGGLGVAASKISGVLSPALANSLGGATLGVGSVPGGVAAVGTGAGGGPVFNVTVNGWVGNDQDLAQRLLEVGAMQMRGGRVPAFVMAVRAA